METSSQNAGQRLCAALTSEQLQRLLTVVSDAGLLAGLHERLRATDPDLAETLHKLTAAEPAASTGLAISDQKALEIWEKQWEPWQSHVSEVRNEDGTYKNHEEHWHPHAN